MSKKDAHRFKRLSLTVALALAAVVALLGPPGGLSQMASAQEQEPQGSAAPQADVGTAFTYQGRLTDGGSPANGSYDFQFELYNAASGGSLLGTVASGDVAVSDGLFTVRLDFGQVVDGTARYLAIGVRPGSSTGAYTPLIPRQELTPAPHALALPGLWTQQNTTSPNLIGGYPANIVAAGVVGATIGGGGTNNYRNAVNGNHGTVSGGAKNTAGSTYATVGGGVGNIAAGDHASVGGGYFNNASGTDATICGGSANIADDGYATVGGGSGNTAGGEGATVAGGYGNTTTSDEFATIGGGYQNSASGWATVSGGSSNAATLDGATVGGGMGNTASSGEATVAGGNGNTASGSRATVGGGMGNTASGGEATVAGGYTNTASGNRATVGGGETNAASGDHATVAGGFSHEAQGDHTTVGGGWDNTAGDNGATVSGGVVNAASGRVATIGGGEENIASNAQATVGGGHGNVASGGGATIAGGYHNTASGFMATVPGGENNTAEGMYSFAAGHRAKANHQGSFVLADSTAEDFTSVRDDSLRARLNGGATFVLNDDYWVRLWRDGTHLIDTSTGAHLTTGGTWTNSSDRNLKENFDPVDGQQVLARLARMPIQTWNYRAEGPARRHMGPTSQDFYAAFGLGEDDLHIATVDADGVALAAIQGLYEQLQEQAARIQSLEAENAALQQMLEDLAVRLAALEALLNKEAE